MSLGFIILRHVMSEKTDKYWIECYNRVRLFYPDNKVVIIDDHSNKEFLSNYPTTNCEIIFSDFESRGEILPYYLYSKYNWFDQAVIIHDSVFIQKYTDFACDKYKLLWFFPHDWDDPVNEIKFIKFLDNSEEILNFYYRKNLWVGCLGVISVISHTFLKSMDDRYNFSTLMTEIKTRQDRMCLERIIPCIFQYHHPVSILLGNIFKYCKEGLTYEEYKNSRIDLPLIKVWTGR